MTLTAASPLRASTGLASLDALLGPRRPGLILILGMPGAGRTSLALKIARSMAREGIKTIFFSCEHSLRALLLRLLCATVGARRRELDRIGLVDELDFVVLGRSLELDGRWTLESHPWPTQEHILARIRELRSDWKIEGAILDSLQFVHERNGFLPRLRELARELRMTAFVSALITGRQAARLAQRRDGNADGASWTPPLPDRVILLDRRPAPNGGSMELLRVRVWRERGEFAGATTLGLKDTTDVVDLEE